jgi:hypothetical protein
MEAKHAHITLNINSLDIVQAVREYPTHRTQNVQWKGQVESVKGNIAVVHLRRKIVADHFLHYMAKLYLAQPIDLWEGDKILFEGEIFGELEVHNEGDAIRYMLGISEPAVHVLEYSALRKKGSWVARHSMMAR